MEIGCYHITKRLGTIQDAYKSLKIMEINTTEKP